MFDTDIFLSTNKSGAKCPKTIALLTADIERKLMFGNSIEKLAVFNEVTQSSITMLEDLPNIGDIMWWLSDVFTMGVQYGGRTKMCTSLMDDTWYNATADK